MIHSLSMRFCHQSQCLSSEANWRRSVHSGPLDESFPESWLEGLILKSELGRMHGIVRMARNLMSSPLVRTNLSSSPIVNARFHFPRGCQHLQNCGSGCYIGLVATCTIHPRLSWIRAAIDEITGCDAE